MVGMSEETLVRFAAVQMAVLDAVEASLESEAEDFLEALDRAIEENRTLAESVLGAPLPMCVPDIPHEIGEEEHLNRCRLAITIALGGAERLCEAAAHMTLGPREISTICPEISLWLSIAREHATIAIWPSRSHPSLCTH